MTSVAQRIAALQAEAAAATRDEVGQINRDLAALIRRARDILDAAPPGIASELRNFTLASDRHLTTLSKLETTHYGA